MKWGQIPFHNKFANDEVLKKYVCRLCTDANHRNNDLKVKATEKIQAAGEKDTDGDNSGITRNEKIPLYRANAHILKSHLTIQPG